MTDSEVAYSTQPKIYVVSLERATERRQAISQQLSNLGLEFTFVDAIDAAKADPHWLRSKVDEVAVLRNLGRGMSGPEIACFLSHKMAYADIVRNNLVGGLVLEDDALITPLFVDAQSHFCTNGTKLARSPSVVHLGALSRPYARTLILRKRSAQRITEELSFAQQVSWNSTEVQGSFGYYITLKAAETLMLTPRLENVIDCWSSWARNYGNLLMVAVPAVVAHPIDIVDSEIEKSRLNAITAADGRCRVCRAGSFLYHGFRRRFIEFVAKPLTEKLY